MKTKNQNHKYTWEISVGKEELSPIKKVNKKTYLLSAPFPMEEIILGDTKYEVLKLLYKGGNPHSISKFLKKTRPTTIQHLQELRKSGLVKKGVNDENEYADPYLTTEKGIHLIEKCVGFPLKSSHNAPTEDKKTRGHAFIWKIKPNKSFDWLKILEEKQIKFEPKGIAKTPRILINGKKVWLGKNRITIFEPKWNSFFNKDPIKSRNDAVYEMSEDIESLKKKLGIDFNYKFTCKRQHYGFVDNPDAKLFIKKKKNILIKNEKGYWFSIDFSQNKYKEAETIHERDAVEDGTGYQNLMNSHEKTRFKVTPEFVLENLNKIGQNEAETQQQLNILVDVVSKQAEMTSGLPNVLNHLEQQIKSHLALIQEYRVENKAWRKSKVKEIKKELKEGKQTDLRDFY